MHGLQQLMAFAETARHGSFAAAARSVGGAPSSLAKSVARLEAGLGVKLFHRTTRQVTLTPDGERLFERCQRVLDEVDSLKAEAAGTRAAPSGTLRVESPITYGKQVVVPLLAGLLRRHPAMQLELRLSDGVADLIRDRIDLAVRIGALRDSTLVARRIGRQGLVLCASPAYLAEHGTPRRIEDLPAHAAIAFRMPSNNRDRPWQFRQRGSPVELAPPARAHVNDGEGLLECTRLGLGLCQLPDYLVARDLEAGTLTEVLPSCRPEPLPINVLVPSGRLVPARVRVAIEALAALRSPR